MPAVIPFIPAIVGALGTAYGAVENNQQRQHQKGVINQQQRLYGQVQPQAQNLMNQGQQAIGPALNYYTSTLNDPRSATAPEQNRISSMYAGQANNVRNMYPRGGFGPSAAENLRGQERGAREGVIQQGRPMAASALGNLGTNLSSQGLSGFGLSSGMLSNIMQSGLEANKQQYQQGQGLGSGLFNAYQAYQLGQALKGPRQSGSPGDSLYGGMGGSYNPPTDSWQGFPPPSPYGGDPGGYT